MEISGKQVLLGYFAGIVDGEGTIQVNVPVNAKRRSYYATMYITNTNKELLLMLQQDFGGFLLGPYKNGTNCKLIYRLCWHGRKAIPIFQQLLSVPYFIIKRKQAELALSFEGLRNSKFMNRVGYPEETREKFRRIRDEVKHINKRGIFAASETKPESGISTNDSPNKNENS